MYKTSFYIVNAITIYRLTAAFILLYLLIVNEIELFRWLLAVSFFTDFIDGFIARRYKAASAIGSKLDSIADDLTILMAILGIVVFKRAFIRQEIVLVIILAGLYFIQLILAIFRYGKMSSFHTVLAKTATIFQGLFFMAIFFLPEYPAWLFYTAAVLTILDLSEEIILVLMLPQWTTDVKGIWWLRKRKKL